jgi:uncharacterized membrane protein
MAKEKRNVRAWELILNSIFEFAESERKSVRMTHLRSIHSLTFDQSTTTQKGA